MVKVEELRGMPLQVGNLEEMIDDNHAIVSTVGEHYVPIMSFVDKDQVWCHAGLQVTLGGYQWRLYCSVALIFGSTHQNPSQLIVETSPLYQITVLLA